MLGTIAIVAATSNVVGGFIITDRMLKMFKSSGPENHDLHDPTANTSSKSDLPRRHGAVHSVAEMDEFADHGAARRAGPAKLGMLLAIVGTLLHHGIVDYKWIAIALVLGTIIGVPLGKVQMTAVPQRTALSHAFGALASRWSAPRNFICARRTCRTFMMSVLSHGSDSRLAHFYRQPDGRRKIAGNPAAAPYHLQGPELVNLGVLGVAVGVAVILVLHPEHTYLFPALIVDSAAFRRDDDYPDRRRGHADGDFAAELRTPGFPPPRWVLCSTASC